MNQDLNVGRGHRYISLLYPVNNIISAALAYSKKVAAPPHSILVTSEIQPFI
ncbi:hypothetical protein AFE_2511 [Acidithiobacillus ferrooxidans ATCC 23270]|uniref:Uncharacterized protein n=1 Tax=Acidithiobacillus ferrooxidans (strain ATCC 23270 / DSM 14882 / CIP 104768 / NCIMB 8455) TaxID=243159 RepID=B7J745_ACIF2|nr:hypothetical protein AFE_2511 [Acidithiobacillus ferrooxidans ATCC 23270]